eukprot:scaffold78959_cov18-Prasinocladus_malaysianus.AAC.2
MLDHCSSTINNNREWLRPVVFITTACLASCRWRAKVAAADAADDDENLQAQAEGAVTGVKNRPGHELARCLRRPGPKPRPPASLVLQSRPRCTTYPIIGL